MKKYIIPLLTAMSLSPSSTEEQESYEDHSTAH